MVITGLLMAYLYLAVCPIAEPMPSPPGDALAHHTPGHTTTEVVMANSATHIGMIRLSARLQVVARGPHHIA